jgi:hypothetical protein
MKKNFKKNLLVVPFGLALLVLPSCGSSDGTGREGAAAKNPAATDKDKETSSTGTGSIEAPLVQQDEEVIGESITGQVDEAISSAMEDLDASSSASFALLGKEESKKNEVNRFRDCVEDGNKAVVTLKHSFNHENEFERVKFKGYSKLSFLMERTRTWSKEGTAVKCDSTKKRVNLAGADLKGYELAVAIKSEKTDDRSLTKTTKKGEETIARKSSRSSQGTRTVKWTNVANDQSKLTIDKQVTSSMERKMSATNKKGESKSWESTVKTGENAPLLITIIRDSKTSALISRTVKSGTVVGVAKDGTRVETKFDNVLYEKAKKCDATSGKITGAIYAKDATTPSVSYTITFTGSEPTVEFSDGKTYDLNLDGCEFAEDEAKVNEISKKDDIKKS